MIVVQEVQSRAEQPCPSAFVWLLKHVPKQYLFVFYHLHVLARMNLLRQANLMSRRALLGWSGVFRQNYGSTSPEAYSQDTIQPVKALSCLLKPWNPTKIEN